LPPHLPSHPQAACSPSRITFISSAVRASG
jgi:hypothetical protein